MKLSEKIELILSILNQCPEDVRYYQSRLDEADAEKVNLEHELEGVGVENRTPPKYEQRAAIATKLQDTLKKRRVAKDIIRVNEPLLEFINSDVGIRTLRQLEQTLGKLRHVEKQMDERIFRKRVANQDVTIVNQNKNIDKLIKDFKRKGRKKH